MAFRWGLIGAGDIVAKRVGTALRDASGSELVAIARARANLAESSAASLGARRWYARWQDLVADPEIDALYIATPVHLHAPQAIAATEAGKHVLCEKPMGMNIAECDRMLAAARAHGVKLGIAYYRHFYPVIARHAILEPQDTLDILGTEGSVHVATLNKGDLRVCTPRGERREAHAPAANLHLPLVQDFVDQVSRGREPAVNGELGRAVAAIEEAIYVTTRSSPTD